MTDDRSPTRPVTRLPRAGGPVSASGDIERSREKYDCPNPIGRALVTRFAAYLRRVVSDLRPASVLDVGCGDGRLTAQIQTAVPGARIVACDLSQTALRAASGRVAQTGLVAASAYDLPFPDATFDLVVAFEMLEHLETPDLALREITRVASNRVVLSVPDEPLWRLLNIARGKYARSFGNTPGHIQHWGRRAFAALVAEHLSLTAVTRVVPWTVVLAEKQHRMSSESGPTVALPR